ncbi:MAG: IclR family transcriptional regulator domain-containing protein [Pseudoclavibacter sp.]
MTIVGSDKGAGRSESLGGLAKGLRIIECFSESSPMLTVSQAARAVSISPASARRCLLTMHELGYLSYDGKFFRPTPRMRRLGGAYTGSTPLPLLAEPHLRTVRDELDESASLAVLDGDEVLFVARAESQRIVTMNVRLGGRLPAHASSTGRVLLAGQADEQIEDLLRTVQFDATGPKTLTSAAQVMERIRQVREDGMAITDEELEPGVRTVAVPVRDSSGVLQAALSLAVSTARVSVDELRERHVPVMQEAATQLGQSM